jgi:hypothetical protein
VRETRYQVSTRVVAAFQGGPDGDVWLIEAPGPDGAGGQVRLTRFEWDRLINGEGRWFRSLAR